MRISDGSSDVCSSDLLPSGLMNRLQSTGPTRSGGSVTGAAALGFLSALLVGPCMTAPLAGALLYIGQAGSAVQGGQIGRAACRERVVTSVKISGVAVPFIKKNQYLTSVTLH